MLKIDQSDAALLKEAESLLASMSAEELQAAASAAANMAKEFYTVQPEPGFVVKSYHQADGEQDGVKVWC